MAAPSPIRSHGSMRLVWFVPASKTLWPRCRTARRGSARRTLAGIGRCGNPSSFLDGGDRSSTCPFLLMVHPIPISNMCWSHIVADSPVFSDDMNNCPPVSQQFAIENGPFIDDLPIKLVIVHIFWILTRGYTPCPPWLGAMAYAMRLPHIGAANQGHLGIAWIRLRPVVGVQPRFRNFLEIIGK